jgi:Flp pilus assembly protein CpaB
LPSFEYERPPNLDVAEARRVARPGWINLRTVLGLLLFSAALLGGNRLLAAAKETQSVWVAARDIAQDAVLGPGDVEAAEVKLPAGVTATYMSATASLYGEVVTRPLRAGEIIPGTALARSTDPSAARSITIPVEPEHAVGGVLQPGDRVDVLVTFDPENVRARTVLLARAVEVLDVVETGSVAFGEGALVGLTVGVTPEQAPRLAFAVRTGVVDVARVDGSPSGAAKSSTVRFGDLP